jgi:hypothetical protein
MAVKRIAWFTIGIAALGLGIIGIALPLLPTTPFILLAAFAFARSSDRMHKWLVEHQMFGPMIENWRAHGAISRRAKIVSTVSMALIFTLSIVLQFSPLVLTIQGVVIALCITFVLTRPELPAV